MNKKVFIVLLICTSFVFTSWGKQSPKDELWKLRQIGKDPNSVVVMTRNIYFGTDVDYVMAAPTEFDVIIRVAEAVQMFYSTNIHMRAEALAEEIARGQPHLVGLQEVATMRISFPGMPLEEYDFLSILQDALIARGLDYNIAGIVQDIDIIVPMLVSLDPFILGWVQLIDSDVVLARNGVEILESYPVNYFEQLYVPSLDIYVPRGYVSVKAKVGKKTYRFVNTHLEPVLEIDGFQDPSVQLAQAQELIEAFQYETLPVIIVGDLNTPTPHGNTYQLFEANGYVDAWTRNLVQPKILGYTTPHDSNLRNTDIMLDRRIDFIMVKSHVGMNGIHNIGPVFAYVVGDELDDQILNPDDGTLLWPSDHAGVVALLRIPVLGYLKNR